MGRTRRSYQGTEERCQDRLEPQSLARWCNGSAKPLSPPLFPGGLTWDQSIILGPTFLIILDRPQGADIVVIPWHKVYVCDGQLDSIAGNCFTRWGGPVLMALQGPLLYHPVLLTILTCS